MGGGGNVCLFVPFGREHGALKQMHCTVCSYLSLISSNCTPRKRAKSIAENREKAVENSWSDRNTSMHTLQLSSVSVCVCVWLLLFVVVIYVCCLPPLPLPTLPSLFSPPPPNPSPPPPPPPALSLSFSV